jgi:major membrane immunogen (membrane-anchored lipoprotein)
MNKTALLPLCLIIFFSATIALNAQQMPKDTLLLKDGIYTGSSRASYTDEPYWGIVKITVTNNMIGDVKFCIRDSTLHEYFDGSYEKHFEGNNVYVEQCRNDWKGVQKYPAILAEKQDADKVDAISGATWSNNIFKASVKDALKELKTEDRRK